MSLAMIKHNRRIGLTHAIQRHSAIHVGIIRPDDMTRRDLDQVLPLVCKETCDTIAVETGGRPSGDEDAVLYHVLVY